MTEATSRVAVLIACHDRRDMTLDCLAALAQQGRGAALHLFVYDDGCRDGTGDAVRRVAPTATIVRGDGTAFWAGAMRHLFDRALMQDFDHYLWLNDDVVLDPDALDRLIETAGRLAHRPFALVGGAVRAPGTGAVTYGGIDRRAGMAGRLRFRAVPPFADALRGCDTLHGNVVLVPAATARAIGSIGRAFVHTLGDLDYGLRVTARGGAVALAPGSCGTCAGNPRSGRFFRPETPLRTRWHLLGDPLGFPLRPWLAFARAHGGVAWPLLAVAPFWRLLVPGALTRTLRRAGRLRGHPA